MVLPSSTVAAGVFAVVVGEEESHAASKQNTDNMPARQKVISIRYYPHAWGGKSIPKRVFGKTLKKHRKRGHLAPFCY